MGHNFGMQFGKGTAAGDMPEGTLKKERTDNRRDESEKDHGASVTVCGATVCLSPGLQCVGGTCAEGYADEEHKALGCESQEPALSECGESEGDENEEP